MWEPPQTIEERLRSRLVPARLRLRYLLARERARGECEIGTLPFLVDRDRVALDIGANKGVWAEAMRRLAKHVHAFEPNPKIYRELRRLAHADVSVHQIALSDRSAVGELRVPKGRKGYSNQGASLNPDKIGGNEYGSVAVETRRLDDLDLGDIGFMKIDVEGHELAVIDGARETIRRCKPNMIVEIEEGHTKKPIAEMLRSICDHGYEVFALQNGALRKASRIDLARHHTKCTNRSDYIFNWIFIAT